MTWMISESELDIFQRQVLKIPFDSRAVIQGCAGSGKSVLALQLAKHIIESGKESVLVIVFTNALLDFMKAGIEELEIPGEICMLAHKWANLNPRPTADYIIIDEVQDFSVEEGATWGNNGAAYSKGSIEGFNQCARKGMLMFGDDAQRLYSEGSEIINIGQYLKIKSQCYQNLQINYRLPKKIARVAEKIMSVENRDDIEGRCQKEGDNKPVIKKCNSINEEIDYIIDRINELNLENVGIIVPGNKHAAEVFNYLYKKGINTEVKYEIHRNDKINTLDFSSTNPKIMTYHSSKGLQFEAVFLPLFEETRENLRRPIYVAMTRSLDRLYITHTNALSLFLNDVPNDLVNKL